MFDCFTQILGGDGVDRDGEQEHAVAVVAEGEGEACDGGGSEDGAAAGGGGAEAGPGLGNLEFVGGGDELVGGAEEFADGLGGDAGVEAHLLHGAADDEAVALGGEIDLGAAEDGAWQLLAGAGACADGRRGLRRAPRKRRWFRPGIEGSP